MTARLAQIGLGGYGRSILSAVRGAPSADLVAVCDREADLAARVAAETGAEARDADAILGDDSIQGVLLVLPNHLHRPFCERAAAAGKHVFCEKPIANHVADARAMIAACAAAGVGLAIGHNTRRAAGYRQLAAWVAEGRVGWVIDLQAEFTHPGGLHQDPSTWRFDPRLCPTLPLIQLGVHLIDVACAIMGEPVEVTSLQRRRLIPGDNVDATHTLCGFADGSLLSLVSHYCASYRYVCHLTGSDGRIDATNDSAVLHRPDGRIDAPLTPVATQVEEVEEFAQSILGQATIETDGAAATRALAVVEAAWISARERRTVGVAELG